MSKEEKILSPLEAKISQAYRVNEAVEDEQREIKVRLNKIEAVSYTHLTLPTTPYV